MRRRSALVLTLAGFAAAGSPARAQASSVLPIGTPGFDGNALAFYAQDKGVFTRYGIESKIQIIRGSGAGVAGAVTGGSVNVGEADITAVAAAREHGIPLVLLAPSWLHRGPAPTTALVVAKTSTFRNAHDLNSQTIGVPSLSGPTKLATAKWLMKNGADISTIKFVEMVQTSTVAALERGTVAAATTNEPSFTASADLVRFVAYPYDAIANPLQVSGWFATEDWVKNNTDLAKRFIAALHETAIWANNPANQAASGAILQKYNAFAPELIAKMHRAAYGETFELAIMQPLLDAAFEQRSLPTHMAAKELLSSVAVSK
jgi:NitT/TauT family transport system substrate-binding protein